MSERSGDRPAVANNLLVFGVVELQLAVMGDRRAFTPDAIHSCDKILEAVGHAPDHADATDIFPSLDILRCLAPRGRSDHARTADRKSHSCRKASPRAQAAHEGGRPPTCKDSGRMSGVFGQRFGRKNSRTGSASAP